MPTLELATDIDPNVWYQLSELAVDTADKDLNSMLQPTAPGGDLRVWPANKNSYWQFQKIGDKPGRYQLRCSDTTVVKQLSVCYRPDVIDEKRRTRPCLMATDDSEEQQWDVSLWGKDDSYRITNVRNGTKWNLDCIPDGPVFMSSNLEGKQIRQQWLLQSVGEVNNKMYSTTYSAPPESTGDSTAITAGTTASNSETTATSDPSSNEPSSSGSSSSSSNANDDGNNGLSSGAVAGISVAITLAVVALALAGFFFWRRNKRKHSLVASSDSSDDKHDHSPTVLSPVDGTGSYYSPEKVSGAAEMPQEQRPAELPNGQHQRHELA